MSTPLRVAILGRANYGLLQTRINQLAGHELDLHVLSLQDGDMEGCTVHHIQSPGGPGPLKYLLALGAVRRALKRIQPDVLDVHSVSSWGVYGFRPLADLPFLATVYGPDLNEHAARHRLIRFIARRCFQKAHRVFSSTMATCEGIKRITGLDVSSKYVSQSWGIDCTGIQAEAATRRSQIRNEFGLDDRQVVVLHNRQFIPFWHIDELLQAGYRLLEAHEHLHFWFVYPVTNKSGEDLIREKTREIQARGFADRIILHGPQPYDRMISMMHASDVYTCCGRNDLLSSSILEAMATGLVVVLRDLPAYHEVIQPGENGIFFSSATSEALHDALEDAVSNLPDYRERFAEPNRSYMAEHYDEGACAAWLVEQYRSLADQGRLSSK
jgi:L-malate glycosyltransferase